MKYDDLSNEYRKTKQEINDYNMLVGKSFQETSVIRMFLDSLSEKLKKMKRILKKDLEQHRINERDFNDTIDGFN